MSESTATRLGDIVDLIGELNITDQAIENSFDNSLAKATDNVIRTATATNLQG